jgi:hypothetical protein
VWRSVVGAWPDKTLAPMKKKKAQSNKLRHSLFQICFNTFLNTLNMARRKCFINNRNVKPFSTFKDRQTSVVDD